MQDTMCDSTISNSIQLFADKGFKIRVIMRDGEPWFVAKDVAACIEYDLSNVSKMCKLCRERDVCVESASKFDSYDLYESGNSRITLISESGLYRILAKCNLPKCEPFESWVFDEVLPSIRKTGSYGVTQISRKDQLFLDIIHAESEAVRVDALKELAEINKQEMKALTAERDEAIRTKAMIGSKREATAMNTASQKSKECIRLTNENEELKDAVGRGSLWRTVSMMKAEWIREFGHAPVWQKLRQFSKDVGIEPLHDVEEKVILPNGSEKVSISYRYHREAWARYRKYEENLRVTDAEIKNV